MYDDEEDNPDIVRDGESVRTSLVLMDNARDHQPHYVGHAAPHVSNDAARTERINWIRGLTDAWRGDANPPQFTCPECHGTGRDPDDDSKNSRCDMCGGSGSIRGPNRLSSFQRRDPGPYPDADLRLDSRSIADRKRAAYENYCLRLVDAWKRPMDAAEPTNSSSPTEWRAHRHDIEPDHDLEARLRGHQRARDDAWEDYKNRLGEQWRHGRTDPDRATAIMRQAKSENWRHGA
jgi:hypothetical protein